MPSPPVVLSIAGYDPSSGAGVTADVKTAAALGCYAITSITALTVQSTQGVFGVASVLPEIVSDTLSRLKADFDIAAVRIGMLRSAGVANAVADFLEREKLPNVVLDPIVHSSSGASLLDFEGAKVLRDQLLPLANLVTPNLEEAAILAGTDAVAPELPWDQAEARIRETAARIHERGGKAVLITGGHFASPVDFLSYIGTDGQTQTEVFGGQHIASRSTHGTGCALATAIACLLAQGHDLPTAVGQAKEFVRQAILRAHPLGKGTGPVNHLWNKES